MRKITFFNWLKLYQVLQIQIEIYLYDLLIISIALYAELLLKFHAEIWAWMLLSKNRDRLTFGYGHSFAPGVPKSQNLQDSYLDHLLDKDKASVIDIVSCLLIFQERS